jgi:transcriptional regulator with XRE-family HTH domain
MDIVTRLKQFMDYTQLPSSQFADQAQIPRPTLSQIMNGRNKKISNELITKLHEAFPQLNVMWLMFGDGDMVTGENIQFSEPQKEQNLFEQQEQDIFNQVDTFVSSEVKPITNSAASTQSAAKSVVDVPKTAIHIQKSDKTNEAQAIPITPDSNSKKIASIMVFYTDNSFESYLPSQASD